MGNETFLLGWSYFSFKKSMRLKEHCARVIAIITSRENQVIDQSADAIFHNGADWLRTSFSLFKNEE